MKTDFLSLQQIELLISKITESKLPEEQKTKLLERLQEMKNQAK